MCWRRHFKLRAILYWKNDRIQRLYFHITKYLLVSAQKLLVPLPRLLNCAWFRNDGLQKVLKWYMRYIKWLFCQTCMFWFCMVRVFVHYMRRLVDVACLPSTDIFHLQLSSGFIMWLGDFVIHTYFGTTKTWIAGNCCLFNVSLTTDFSLEKLSDLPSLELHK
jgi:hypothetical protein